MKRLQGFCLCLAGGVLLAVATTTPANADPWNKKTYVTTNQSIEVPGAILPPGKYVFKLLDSPSNRHIVQILNDRENHVFSTNLAIPKERMEPAGKTIITFYEVPGGGPEPIKAWFYPGDLTGQEFVYPKQRMSQILAAIQRGNVTVAEARPSAPVESTPPATEEANPAPTPNPPPAPEPPQAEEQVTPPAEQQTPAPAPPAAAAPPPAEPAPSEPAMPHTAGNTFAIGLLGLTCAGGAVSLRLVNRRFGNKA